MTDAEFLETREELEKRYKEELDSLCRQYTDTNKRFKIGDILTSPSGCIFEVEKILYSLVNSKIPVAYYRGKELTKKLHPRKDGSVRMFSDRHIDLKKVK